MSDDLTSLEKAKAALSEAKALTDGVDLDAVDVDRHVAGPYMRLLDIANIQANIATAEAMTRIADRLDQHLWR